jgi:hypothetical protein
MCWGWLKYWRQNMLHISYRDQQGCGGSIIAPPSLQMLRSHRESSLKPSVEFIFH